MTTITQEQREQIYVRAARAKAEFIGTNVPKGREILYDCGTAESRDSYVEHYSKLRAWQVAIDSAIDDVLRLAAL